MRFICVHFIVALGYRNCELDGAATEGGRIAGASAIAVGEMGARVMGAGLKGAAGTSKVGIGIVGGM